MMIKRPGNFFVVVLLILAGCNQPDNSSPTNIVATVDIQSQLEPISPYMYGMFLEHLGNADVGDLIDDGLWAELLDDRKFFYPVDRNDEFVPPNKRDSTNQWVPVGNTVTMDSANAYVGIHSPKVITSKGGRDGIAQSGLWVLENKNYVGRIVLAGTPGISVTITLTCGDQQTSYTVNKLNSQYIKYSFSLQSAGKSNNAKLEITGTGDGSFSVGAVSLMPSDNIDGFRPDVIALLKDLNSGLYRWGGNMSSGYDWRDGIGDPDQRPPRYEYAWDAMENNDVGTHELMRFAELINVKLAMTVNGGLGDAHSAGEWVQYVNGSRNTPMGKLRSDNGHPESFGIELWCVGNESYGWWQLGHVDLKNHIIRHKMFAEKMKAADPTIKLIASGASLEEMTITGSAMKETGKIMAEYDSASDWTGGMLRHALKDIDFMSEHYYCAVDQEFDITKGKYITVDEPLVDWTRRPANRVRAKWEHYIEYHRRIPGSERVPMYIDEYAYFTNWVHPRPTLGVAIGYARALHEMFRHTEMIKMAGFTFGTSCLSFDDNNVVYNASGLLFKLYKSQFGTIPLAVSGNSPQPAPQRPIGGPQPTINAGGDTYPLDIVAALTEDRKALTIAIVNPTETDQRVTIEVNSDVSGSITKWEISGTSIDARNIVGMEPEVKLAESTEEFSNELVLRPATINIYRYNLKQ